ncbi:unnamed protein product [Cladocopium goreaui]|uniref:Uncharacterized protein n=1 Tax=Cladocopium goreaui TaxID=2562237 RepID=A0A9P1FEE9_9DINO|nr:unnamed protein product [Cladocopium goreaui]
MEREVAHAHELLDLAKTRKCHEAMFYLGTAQIKELPSFFGLPEATGGVGRREIAAVTEQRLKTSPQATLGATGEATAAADFDSEGPARAASGVNAAHEDSARQMAKGAGKHLRDSARQMAKGAEKHLRPGYCDSARQMAKGAGKHLRESARQMAKGAGKHLRDSARQMAKGAGKHLRDSARQMAKGAEKHLRDSARQMAKGAEKHLRDSARQMAKGAGKHLRDSARQIAKGAGKHLRESARQMAKGAGKHLRPKLRKAAKSAGKGAAERLYEREEHLPGQGRCGAFEAKATASRCFLKPVENLRDSAWQMAKGAEKHLRTAPGRWAPGSIESQATASRCFLKPVENFKESARQMAKGAGKHLRKRPADGERRAEEPEGGQKRRQRDSARQMAKGAEKHLRPGYSAGKAFKERSICRAKGAAEPLKPSLGQGPAHAYTSKSHEDLTKDSEVRTMLRCHAEADVQDVPLLFLRQPSGFSVATLRLSLLFAELLGAAKVAAPCGEGGRSNFHRANIGAAREFRSIRGRTECYAKGPIVRIAWARMFVACLTRAKVAAPCREVCRSNFHRANIGAAREFRSIRGRTECYAKGPIVRIAWARMFADVQDVPLLFFTLGPSLQDGCLMRQLEFRRLRHRVAKVVGRIFIAPTLVLRENFGAFVVAWNADCSDLLRLAMKNPFEQGYAKPTALKFCVFACRHHAMADIPKMPIDEDSEIEAACLTRAKVAAPCREGCRSNFHRAKIGVAREFRSIRGRTECYAKGPIVRMAWDCSDLLRLAMKNPFEQGYAKPTAFKFCAFACQFRSIRGRTECYAKGPIVRITRDCSDLLRLAMKDPFEQGYAKPTALKFCVFACRIVLNGQQHAPDILRFMFERGIPLSIYCDVSAACGIYVSFEI